MHVVTLKPRMSEKAYAASVANNTYVFDVPLVASKAEIMAAVAKQFKVTVEDARMTVIKGKTKQSYRKGRRAVTGSRVDIKKAYVRIKAGDKITIFEAEEKEAKEAKKAAAKETEKTTTKSTASQDKQKRSLKQVFTHTPRQTQNRGGEK
jgi:large subunit ribosomal protein L23